MLQRTKLEHVCNEHKLIQYLCTYITIRSKQFRIISTTESACYFKKNLST